MTGVKGLNQPLKVVPSEMLRLNTSTPPTPAASQNDLGVLGKDLAGFPNGRRPYDDVVDITLRVAEGALCGAIGPDTAHVRVTGAARKGHTFYSPPFLAMVRPIPDQSMSSPSTAMVCRR